MAIATLEFNLDDEDDSIQFDRVMRATEITLALYEIEQLLRREEKYTNYTPEVYERLSDIRDKFYEILSDHGIKLDDILN